MMIEQLIELQNNVIKQIGDFRKDKKTDEYIASAFIESITARNFLLGYKLKQDHPELYDKVKVNEFERKEAKSKYMKEYFKHYNKKIKKSLEMKNAIKENDN